MIAPVTPVRVLRIVTRLNVGGHARTIYELWRGLDPAHYEQRILSGQLAPDETDFLAGHAPDMPVIRIPTLHRSVSPVRDALAFAAIRRQITAFRPDVVHTHLSKAGALGRLAVTSAYRRPKTIHTYHGLVLDGILSPRGARAAALVERALARRTDRLLTEGSAVRDRLIELGIGRPDQFEVLPPGMSLRALPQRAAARSSLGLPIEALVVTMAGRLVPEKCPERFVELARRCAADFPESRVLLVGGGPLEAQLRASTSSVGNLQLLGWRSDVETILAATDAVALTSDSEGMPLSLVEAGLAGLPAVTTDVGSADEIVLNGESGFVCGRSVDALEASLRRLLSDEALRRRMGFQARVVCERNFSAARLVADVDRIYASVLAGSTAPGSTV